MPGTDQDFPYTLGIATNRVEVGAHVLGIGYPETMVEGEPGGILKIAMNSKCYRGRVVGWRRDLVEWNGIRGPGYEHSAHTPCGFSGGPLIRRNTGMIHGVMAGSFFSALGGPSAALDLKSVVEDWVVPVLGDMTLREFARRNPKTITVR